MARQALLTILTTAGPRINLQSFLVVLLQPTMKILAEPPGVNDKNLAAILSFKLNSSQHGVL
jgi:hypothetical protein